MSFPKYSKYKDSGVEWLGEVPEHWEVVRGRRLFSQKREPALEQDEQLSATQKYGVVPQKVFMDLEDQKVALALSGTNNFKHVEKDDFVISLRSFQGGIERSVYSGCVSPAYTVLRPTQTIIAVFWAYLLKSAGYVESLQTMTDGIRDGKTISYQQFGQIGLPLPSLEEQVALASLLDRETSKIDALIAEQMRLIELLQEKRQAVISHAVTKGLNPDAPMKASGIEWLGEVPEHWTTARVKFGSLRISKGDTPSNFGMDFAVDGPVRFIKIENIGEGHLIETPRYSITFEAHGQLKRSQLRPHDVVFAIAGATTGKCAIVLECHLPANTNQAVAYIRPNSRIAPQFLVAWLQSRGLRESMWEMTVQSAQPNLSMENLGNLPLLMPPLDEQEAIVVAVNSVADQYLGLVAEAERAVTLLQERRSALISAAVTGQIDVRGLASSEAA